MTARQIRKGAHVRAPLPPRDDLGHFLSNTAHMQEQLRLALATVSDERAALASALQALNVRYGNGLTLLTNVQLLPDLSAVTIAKLKRDLPGYVSKLVQDAITAAQNIEVPFWTWFWGNSDEYTKTESTRKLIALRSHLQTWLKAQNPPPACMIETAKIGAEYTATKERLEAARAKEASLKEQIDKLERVTRTYSRQDAPPPPPELTNAINQSSDQMRANPGFATSASSGSNFSYVDDVLIPQIIFDAAFRHHDDERRRFDDHGSYTPRPRSFDDTGPAWTGRREGGGHEGNASVRMNDTEEAREGNASVRMSDMADEKEGNTSVRMSNDPVIADVGRSSSSVRLADTTDDTKDDSGGTKGTAY